MHRCPLLAMDSVWDAACMLPLRSIVAILGLFVALDGSCAFGQSQPQPRPAENLPTGLDLASLEELALQSNPTLVQAGAQISVSRSKALQAGLYPNPTVGYQAELIGVNGTPGEFQGGYIQQTIVTAGKLRLSRAKYCQEAREAAILALGQQLRVLNGVRTQFYELLATERMIELRRELVINAEENLRTTREMFNTGLANQANVLLAENEFSRAKIDLATRENEYEALWQHLIATLGTPELALSRLEGQLEPNGPPLDWDESFNRLLADSPELEAARVHVIHDHITIQRERIEPIPNIMIQAGVGYNFENPGTNTNVAAAVELPLFDRNQGTLRQAQGELMRSQAAVQRIELSLRQRLAEVFNQYRTALVTSEQYRESIVPNAGKAYELQLDMYNQRRVAWPEVVELRRNMLQTQSEYTHSLLELRRSEVAITGLLLVDGLTPPSPPTPGGHLEATPKPR